MDHKLKKWIKWLSVIEEEISELTIGKHIYWQIWQLLKANETTRKNLLLFHYLNNSYISYSVMGIRRQIKTDKQSISLVRLLVKSLGTLLLKLLYHYSSLCCMMHSIDRSRYTRRCHAHVTRYFRC